MIEIRNLTKHYGTKTALDNVSLSIPDNSIVGLVGQNGAGKSTLLKILTGIMKADDGHTWDNWRRYLLDFLPQLFR